MSKKTTERITYSQKTINLAHRVETLNKALKAEQVEAARLRKQLKEKEGFVDGKVVEEATLQVNNKWEKLWNKRETDLAAQVRKLQGENKEKAQQISQLTLQLKGAPESQKTEAPSSPPKKADDRKNKKLVDEACAGVRAHWQRVFKQRETVLTAEKRALEIQCKHMANTVKQLSENVRTLREARKKEKSESEAQSQNRSDHSQTMTLIDQAVVEVTKFWQTKWDQREEDHKQEVGRLSSQVSQIEQSRRSSMADREEWQSREKAMVAEREALCTHHAQEVNKLHQEIASLKKSAQKPEDTGVPELLAERDHLKKTLMASKQTLEESKQEWEDRWTARNKQVAAETAALHEDYKVQLGLLTEERDQTLITAKTEKMAVVEENLLNLREMSRIKVDLFDKEADWSRKCSTLKGRLKTELVAKERATQLLKEKEEVWATKEAQREEMDLTVQRMNEEILRLSDLAQMTDKEKAERRRAEKKAAKEAARQRAREGGEREGRWWQLWK